MTGHGAAMTAAEAPAKSVKVYRNGDANWPGRKFVINERTVKTYETFLQQVSDSIRAPFGAVRNLYKPTRGHRVAKLDDLVDGKSYVAAGPEKFKKISYEEIHSRHSRVVHVKKHPPKAEETFHSTGPDVQARCNIVDQPRTVHIFRNGDALHPGYRVLLTKRQMFNWDQVLNIFTLKAKLNTGAVRKVYTLEGAEVKSIDELENGQQYVCVGSEKFKKLPYVASVIAAPLTSGDEGKHAKEDQRRRKLTKKTKNKKSKKKAGDTSEVEASEAEGVDDHKLPPIHVGKGKKEDKKNETGPNTKTSTDELRILPEIDDLKFGVSVKAKGKTKSKDALASLEITVGAKSHDDDDDDDKRKPKARDHGDSDEAQTSKHKPVRNTKKSRDDLNDEEEEKPKAKPRGAHKSRDDLNEDEDGKKAAKSKARAHKTPDLETDDDERGPERRGEGADNVEADDEDVTVDKPVVQKRKRSKKKERAGAGSKHALHDDHKDADGDEVREEDGLEIEVPIDALPTLPVKLVAHAGLKHTDDEEVVALSEDERDLGGHAEPEVVHPRDRDEEEDVDEELYEDNGRE
eukprot:Colp12_sorted_trinity150504_noHs@6103